jgi:hypothetical protein
LNSAQCRKSVWPERFGLTKLAPRVGENQQVNRLTFVMTASLAAAAASIIFRDLHVGAELIRLDAITVASALGLLILCW